MKRLICLVLVLASLAFAPADAPPPYAELRSVTFFEMLGATEAGLVAAIPRMKQAQFNAVWLVPVWHDFDPHPLIEPRAYNDVAFEQLDGILNLLRENDMEAILPLNYMALQEVSCDWIKNPAEYAAFEAYVTEFLTRIEAYSDMIYIMVFTEGTEPCSGVSSWQEHAALLRTTLGSLPDRLPPTLRAKFRIGYHDYSLINLGYALPDSPIVSDFDFVSMTAYALEGMSADELDAELDLRALRFPDKPLLLGEFGARGCGHEDNQSRVDGAIIDWAIRNGHGFNLWGWKNNGEAECSNPVYGGLAITDASGNLTTQMYELLVPRYRMFLPLIAR